MQFSLVRMDFRGARAPGANLRKTIGVYVLRPGTSAGVIAPGNGKIVGTVKEKSSPANRPLVRRVSLFLQKNSLLLASTKSDIMGNYEFRNLSMAQQYFVISHDPDGNYNGVTADYLTPVSMT